MKINHQTHSEKVSKLGWQNSKASLKVLKENGRMEVLRQNARKHIIVHPVHASMITSKRERDRESKNLGGMPNYILKT